MTANDDEPQARRSQDTIGEAFKILKEAIQQDDAYAYGWHANISMALYDAMPETFWMPDKNHWHKITNEAASVFMKRAFDAETSADMLILTKEEPDDAV